MNEDSIPEAAQASDPLEALLADANRPILDDGFTVRVIKSLPPRRRWNRLRLVLLASAWLGGAAILALHSRVLRAVSGMLLDHARGGDPAALLTLLPVVLALGSLVWGLMSLAWDEG